MKPEEAILRTLRYSDHFNFPLTLKELRSRLVSIPTPSDLTRKLANLEKRNLIAKTAKYYHLPGKEKIISLRLANNDFSLGKINYIKKIIAHISHTPFIMAVFITGSLAVLNSENNGDIDLMIVTSDNRLWLTRLLLTIYTSLFGLRRFPGEKESNNKLCLNLYLTPKSLTLPTHKRSLYTAYELIQALPIYDPLDIRSRLLTSNIWLKSYLPNFPRPSRSHLVGQNKITNLRGVTLMDILNSLAFKIQYLYMKSKITREYITLDSAFFHPHDPSPKL